MWRFSQLAELGQCHLFWSAFFSVTPSVGLNAKQFSFQIIRSAKKRYHYALLMYETTGHTGVVGESRTGES